jgi:lipopolysaccharide transport system ATP-binding protein
MSKPIIECRQISKSYRLGAIGVKTLRDELTQWWSGREKTDTLFWALRDVSFEVAPGEILAIVGRNGAGKSTLLKILSRITTPTSGEGRVRGRIASLLEVGTGFHPDLSGRDNIYLNGAVLGMRHAEIRRKFDNIVEFAGVSQFIDTPVKRYSSGMYVRLAFAVAAHLRPQILLIDEVMAVGDAAFQSKCLNKMHDLAGSGHTVLLVSHQMQVVQSLASRAILLEEGKLTLEGHPSVVIARYLGHTGQNYDLSKLSRPGSTDGWFTAMSVTSEPKRSQVGVQQGDPMTIHLGLETQKPIPGGNISVAIRNSAGVELFAHNWSDQYPLLDLAPGRHEFDVTVPTQFLRPGPHWITVSFARNQGNTIQVLTGLELPPIISPPGADPVSESRRWGVVCVPCQWKKTN